MIWYQLVVLALLQGLTEFLPISSSGHLILVPYLSGWSDQGLAFDVAVHFGTLAAVLLYFRHDVRLLLNGSLELTAGRTNSPESRMALALIVATIPAALLGLVMHDFIVDHLRTAIVIGVTTAGFGVLLGAMDHFGRRQRESSEVTLKDAVLVGLAQALSLIPGTSRSGITITAAMALGFTRTGAARFSFLLSIPIIVLAAAFETYRLISTGSPVTPEVLLIATGLSAVTAYLTIGFFLRVVDKIGLMPFAIYRVILGIGIIYLLS